jgi:hypothetical protein
MISAGGFRPDLENYLATWIVEYSPLDGGVFLGHALY